MGPRTGLQAVEKRIFLTLPGFEHCPLNTYLVVIPTALSRVLGRRWSWPNIRDYLIFSSREGKTTRILIQLLYPPSLLNTQFADCI
jgi:hypothetical protein